MRLIRDVDSLLRPETVESLFYLWRVTGDTMYQDWGWGTSFGPLMETMGGLEERPLGSSSLPRRCAVAYPDPPHHAPRTTRPRTDIFEAIELTSRVETGGFAGLRDVRNAGQGQRDEMESFFIAETLKYLFLLFEAPPEQPDAEVAFPLSEWVSNTEAHPLRMMKAHA